MLWTSEMPTKRFAWQDGHTKQVLPTLAMLSELREGLEPRWLRMGLSTAYKFPKASSHNLLVSAEPVPFGASRPIPGGGPVPRGPQQVFLGVLPHSKTIRLFPEEAPVPGPPPQKLRLRL